MDQSSITYRFSGSIREMRHLAYQMFYAPGTRHDRKTSTVCLISHGSSKWRFAQILWYQQKGNWTAQCKRSFDLRSETIRRRAVSVTKSSFIVMFLFLGGVARAQDVAPP